MAALDIHQYGNLVLWPYATDKNRAAENDTPLNTKLGDVGRGMRDTFNSIPFDLPSGLCMRPECVSPVLPILSPPRPAQTRFKAMPWLDGLGSAGGTAMDWFYMNGYNTVYRPYAFTVELEGGLLSADPYDFPCNGMNLPAEYIAPVGQELTAAILYLGGGRE